MVRKSGVTLSLLSAVALAACSMHVGAGNQAKAPPPAPAPTTTAPTPAPTTAPTTETPATETPTPAETTTPTPAPGPKVTVKGADVQVPGNIVFETGKSTLQAAAGNEQVLQALKAFLEQEKQITKLRIGGHTDNVGKEEDNLKLSGERALAIKQWLVTNGIAKDRLIAVGFGQTKPIVSNDTEEGRAQNRRTEFKIVEVHGKPYLTKDPTGGGQVFELP